MAFFSCCLRIAIFVLVWVSACDAAPRASVDAYFFSLFAHCHVFIYTSYLNAPLAFPPDSLGCLGLPRTWLIFSGLAVVGVSGSVPSLFVSFGLFWVGIVFCRSAHTNCWCLLMPTAPLEILLRPRHLFSEILPCLTFWHSGGF